MHSYGIISASRGTALRTGKINKVLLLTDLMALFTKSKIPKSFPWTTPKMEYEIAYLCATLYSWREYMSFATFFSVFITPPLQLGGKKALTMELWSNTISTEQ